MKRLIPLLIAIALPTILFAQGQPGRDTENRERPGLGNSQDSQFMDSQNNPMDTEMRRGHRQPGADLQRFHDGSRDQQWQSTGNGDSRGNFRHGTGASRFRYRDWHRGYGRDFRRDWFFRDNERRQ
jgi:hypothetical protein